MHYFVDAYNLLFRTLKKRASLEKSRQLLIEEINQAASDLHLHLTLVFDGAEDHPFHFSKGNFDAIELIYTSEKKSADEYISEEVIHAKNPTQITVVTNDRELAKRCSLYRAKILSIDAFISLVQKKKTKKQKKTNSSACFRESNAEFTRLLEIFEKKLLEED